MPKADAYGWTTPTKKDEKDVARIGQTDVAATDSRTAPTHESHAQHAPLPWRYVGGRDSAGPFTIRVPLGAVPYGLMGDYLGDIVAEIQQNPSDQLPGMPEANAAFIVRACNSHDALLAALQAVHAAIVWDGTLPRPADVPPADTLATMVVAAIAKAEAR